MPKPKKGRNGVKNGKKAKENVNEIFSTSTSDLKTMKQQISDIVTRLVGFNCPLDALVLIMGRNKELCEQQLKFIEGIGQFIAQEKYKKMLNMRAADMSKLLLETKIIKICIIILNIHIERTEIFEQQQFKDLIKNDYNCRIRVACTGILLFLSKYNSDFIPETWEEEMTQPNVLPILVKLVKNESSLVGLTALLTINEFLTKYSAKNWFNDYMLNVDGNVFIQCLEKNKLAIRISEWEKSMTKYEHKLFKGEEESKILCSNLFFLNALQHIKKFESACLNIIAQLGGCQITRDKRPLRSKLRRSLCKSIILPKLLDWIEPIPLVQEEFYTITNCLYIIILLIDRCVSCTRKVLKRASIHSTLIRLVRHLDEETAEYAHTIISNLFEIESPTRDMFVNDISFLQLVFVNIFSSNYNIRNHCLKTLFTLVQEYPVEKYVRKYLPPKYMWSLYNYCVDTEVFVTSIKCLLSKTYETQQGKFSKEVDEFVHILINFPDVLSIKEIGNEAFKNQQYHKAVEVYTAALETCPLTPHLLCDPDSCEGKWFYEIHCTLHSNRAQSYIYLKNYTKALEDCDKAIAFSYTGTGINEIVEAKKLRVKTALRRSIAAFELKMYERALLDAAYCLKNSPNDTMIKTNFFKIFTEYRLDIGNKFKEKRCVQCLSGEDVKLKRCANCGERYCSKDCQLEAWSSGHKDMCNKMKERKQDTTN